MKLVVWRLDGAFNVRKVTLQTSLHHHREYGAEMLCGNAGNVVGNGSSNSLRVFDELRGALGRLFHGGPRFVDEPSHVQAIIVGFVESLVVVAALVDGGGKNIVLREQTAHRSDYALECLLQ